ncbi:MAG: hypothetical protein CL943_03075 [Candidatus Diapherotrites archaeon]|uniref:Uncharacterized protein n=1 Tax=Candidatus Iainarchaeum sp. TaxID=3101447 RepID=A0A2D6M1G7_9ARCH|nr:hypothetical protein [Candidatus Diapherotrites archaeon]|tara:strand:+ start:150 stop:1787 length:1638 start_codon:yes stop_codon:yes gene_type:complete
MANKKKILIGSVKKLIALKVPDKEIVVNLRDVGIDEKQAKNLIKLAKQTPSEKEVKKPESNPEPKPLPKPVAKEATPKVAEEKSLDQIKNELQKKDFVKDEKMSEGDKKSFFEKLVNRSAKEPSKKSKIDEIAEAIQPKVEGEKPKPVVEIPAPKPEPKSIEQKPIPAVVPKPVMPLPKSAAQPKSVVQPKPIPAQRTSSLDISKLWEKGILSSVNDKLKEIKEIKADVDIAIEKRADEVAKKEINKIQVLFDSQQSLFMEKVNAKLDEKGKEVEELIDKKIVEMKQTSSTLEKEMGDLEVNRKQYKDFISEMTTKLTELEHTKNKLVSGMNSELIKSKSEMQEFMDSSQSKVRDIDDRVNKTLEVGLSVIDGLKVDAETQLKDFAIKRSDDLNHDMREQLGELKDTKGAFENQIKENLAMLKEMKTTYESQIEGRLKRLDHLEAAIRKEFDPAMFKQQMNDLEGFKQQFVKVIETNVGKFNQAIQEINEQANQAESKINGQIRLIDKKMTELDEFEKTFAEEMGLSVEKAFEKKKQAKSKKKKK